MGDGALSPNRSTSASKTPSWAILWTQSRAEGEGAWMQRVSGPKASTLFLPEAHSLGTFTPFSVTSSPPCECKWVNPIMRRGSGKNET